jgi:Mlc titration factor MtfA (ptsG expression regulator)
MVYVSIIKTSFFESEVALGILFGIFAILFLIFIFKLIEVGYVLKYKKPFYTHFYLKLRNLNSEQNSILKNQFSFYKRLTEKEKKYFEHRVASFIIDKDFIGRENIKITEEIRTLISATAVMLTFGFRDFYIPLISKIIVYPDEFYSKINDEYHKGEFNPKFKSLVLSWKDFKKGFQIDDDNINLGIHEFTHAIHLNSIKERDVSATIFSDSFAEITDFLSNNEALRQRLLDSEYFRAYGYTNQYEFLAVIIETFIETPNEFRSQFPEIYNKTNQMLNFHFAGY